MALDLRPGSWLLAGLLAASTPAWAMGSAAPFTPPRAASAPEPADPAESTSTLPAQGLAGVRLGAVPMALIDGQWWQVGKALRGGRLQAVDAWGATLRHPDGRLERLMLHGAAAWSPPPRNDPRTKGSSHP